MAGDVAVVAGAALAIFLSGALFMLLAVVAAGIREEEQATRFRRDKQLRLRSRAPNYRAAAVRRLAGVGQRIPGTDPEPDA
jgi:hypothetical protein